MVLKRFLIVWSFIFAFFPGYSQELIVPAFDVPALTQAKPGVKRLKMAIAPDTLSLPFFDDFSGSLSPYPKESLWLDSFVYINNGRAVNQLSIGVATFDALDKWGKIYSYASQQPFYADVLTSKPVYMNYPLGSNAYLSFYFQPQGLGDVPETQDSLMVDFYNPKSKKWWNVWKTNGSALHPFKAVVLPVSADSFLVRGFQFRFRNKCSVLKNSFIPGKMGDVDHWNIDYVKLDINRSAKDTIIRDVAFARPLSSLLNSYQSMPWKHFQIAFQQEMRKDIDIYYRNNDTIGHKPDRYFVITDMKGPHQTSFYSGNENIQPQEVYHFTTNLEYPFFTDETDSARFEVKSYLKTESYDQKINDTARFVQVFSNYFAYDDGSPELGYGLSGQGAVNGKVAVRFTSAYADSLSAIRLFFNSTVNEITLAERFNLVVWAATTSGPGAVVTQLKSQSVKDLGRYTTYLLDSSVLINGDFFIGWEQDHESFLNVGMDANNSLTGKLFFNDGFWHKSNFENYALMIRPVFGSRKLATSKPKPVVERPILKIYPNPTSGILYLETPENSNTPLYATLLNASGKVVLQSEIVSSTLNLEDIPSGLYFLVITENAKTVYKSKVIVQH